jgi:thiol-disulfide isomerase/thioredoxin
VHASGLDLATRTRTISLDEYEGRPMIVNVWASWCEACRVEGPEYARFEHAHPEVVIVGVDIQDAPTDAVFAMQGWGWTHESIWDPKGMVGASMPRHDGIPLTFFLDRNHHVVDTVLSNVSYQQLLAGAARIGAV